MAVAITWRVSMAVIETVQANLALWARRSRSDECATRRTPPERASADPAAEQPDPPQGIFSG